MSDSTGSVTVMESLPTEEKMTIVWQRPWDESKKIVGMVENQFIAEVLARELRKTNLFQIESVVPDTATVESPLKFTVWLEGSTESGWCSRSFAPSSTNSVTIGGVLINQKQGVTVARLSKSRRAQGGVCGVGGYLSASDVAMKETLIEWVVEDVVKEFIASRK